MLFSLLGLYALYAVVAYFAIPRLLEQHIETLAGDTLTSHFSAQSVRFNPFDFSLHVEKPILADNTSRYQWFQADNIHINLNAIASLWHQRLTLDELTINKPQVHLLSKKNGDWVYPQVQASPKTSAALENPVDFHIRQFNITDGRLDWESHGEQPLSLSLQQIDYQHKNLNTGQKPSQFTASITTQQGDSLQLEGQYVHQDSVLDAHWKTRIANLPEWLKKLSVAMPGVSIKQAGLTGSGTVRWAASNRQLQLTAKKIRMSPLHIARPSAASFQASEDEGGPSLVAPSLEASDLSFALPTKQLAVGDVSLERATIQLPIDSIFQPENTTAAPAQVSNAPQNMQQKPELSWRIARFHVNNSQLRLTTAKNLGQPVVGIRQLQLENLSNNDKAATFSADLKLPGESDSTPGGQTRLTGQLSLAKGSGNLSYQIQNMALQPWLPVLNRLLKISAVTGLLNSQGQWQWQPDGFQGTFAADLADFSLYDESRRQILGWKMWQLNPSRIDSPQRRIHMGSMLIRGLRGDIQLDAMSHNLKNLLRPESGILHLDNKNPPGDKPSATHHPWNVEWNQMQVEKSHINLTDARVTPPVHWPVTNLTANLTPAAAKARDGIPAFMLETQLGQFTHVLAKGLLSWNNKPPVPQSKSHLRNLDLVKLNPYIRHFFGYEARSGRADIDLEYRIRHQRLKGQLDLTIVQPKLEKIDNPKAAFSLPLKTALALLADSQGIVHLHIPLTGDLEDPRFSISHLLLTAFVKTISRVGTSPFRILADLVGLGKENLQRILFEPGSDALRATEAAKLQKLATALRLRPTIGLHITGWANRPQDGQALRFRQLLIDLNLPHDLTAENLKKWLVKNTIQDRVQRLYISRLGFARWANLQEQYGADRVKLTMQAWRHLLQTVVINDETLYQLAQKRAQQVRDYLHEAEKLPTNRLVVAKAQLSETKPPQAALKVTPVD